MRVRPRSRDDDDYSHSHPCVRWFRSTTLPLRVPLALLKGKWRARVCGAKRPTWNPRFEAYVTALRSATKNAPRDVGRLRAATSVSVPGPLFPAGVLRCTERLARSDGSELAVEFVWPRAATPMAELSRKWSTTSAQTTPDVVRTTEFRELLRTAPALVLPFEPELFGKAANNGQMIGEVDHKSRAADGFVHLASLVTGRSNAAASRSRGLFSLFKRRK